MHSKHFSMLGVQAERAGLWGSAARIIAGLRSTGAPSKALLCRGGSFCCGKLMCFVQPLTAGRATFTCSQA